MSESAWEFSHDDGTVTVYTGVAGRAARTGHRLTIEATRWSGSATVDDDAPDGPLPTALTASIEVDSLDVVAGEGGLTPLTGAEKTLARSNALKSLQADKFATITVECTTITKTPSGFRAEATLTICGHSRPHTLDFVVHADGGRRAIRAETTVSHREFGIKPYSLMMGALKVADEVRVVVEAVVDDAVVG